MKVLFLNSYDTSFIQNQIIDLKNIGNIEVHFNIHLSYWKFFKYKKCKLKNIFSTTQQKTLSKSEMSLTLHWGLPKEYLTEYEPFNVARKLMKKFKRTDFDLIHAQNGFPSGMVAKILAKKWNIPYLVTSHGMDTNRCLPDSLEQTNVKQFSPAIIARFRDALLNANRVIGVSLAFSELMKKVVPEINPITIQNSYNSDLFRIIPKEELKKRLKLDSFSLVLIYVANLIPQKRHIDVIKAMSFFRGKNIKLVLIGDGSEKDNILNEITNLHIENQVSLISSLPQRELTYWYNASDVVIFPSLKDSFGLSLVEAMACGCPAISTPTYGPLEIVQRGENGFFVDFKAPDQIAQQIEKFYENPELINTMGFKAAESVKLRYAGKNKELFELYKEVLLDYGK